MAPRVVEATAAAGLRKRFRRKMACVRACVHATLGGVASKFFGLLGQPTNKKNPNCHQQKGDYGRRRKDTVAKLGTASRMCKH